MSAILSNAMPLNERLAQREVAVAVTAFGAAWREGETNGHDDLWCVLDENSALSPLFDPSKAPSLFRGELTDWLRARVQSTCRKKNSASTLHGLAADATRRGVAFSSSKGFALWREPDKSSWLEAGGGCDAAALALARLVEARGPLWCPVAACATGAHALALAAQQIEDGYADWMLAGAIEFPAPPLVLAAYESLGALSRQKVMRPFDARRDGFVPNCGAGFVILENAEVARARRAPIHAYLTGASLRADATSMTGLCPSGETIALAIEAALRRAGVPRLDYINAHGTATLLNDEVESRALAMAVPQISVSSTKARTGHLLGAAGAVEAVLSVLALQQNYAPPTLNLETPDAACALRHVAAGGEQREIKSVLSLSYGFGGHLGALVFEK